MAFLDSELTTDKSTSIKGVLNQFGDNLIEQFRVSLGAHGLADSNLLQSMNYSSFQEDSGLWRFQLFFDEYGEYLDEGVQGKGGKKASGGSWRNQAPTSKFRFRDKKPPLRGSDPTNSLEVWSNTRNINKWAVQESIYRQGIKPRHWFSDVVDGGIIEDLLNALQEQGVKQIQIDVAEQLKGILNGK